MRNFEKELKFRTSRSSGSGGQHVNKVSTKVELLFDVLSSELLEDAEKEIVLEKLSNIITKEGVLQMTAQSTRSQLRNKELVIEKFYTKMNKALTPDKPRKKTRKPRAVKEKRLEQKRRTSAKKELRKKVNTKNGVDLFCFSSSA